MGFVEDIFSPAAGMADLAGGDKAVFGTKPKVAPFVPTSLQEEGARALEGNIEAFGDIEKFLNMIVPGFTDTLTQGLGISREEMAAAMPLLRGEIPEDELAQLQRTNAYASLQGGFGGTPLAAAREARNILQTSSEQKAKGVQLAAAGQNSAQMWTQLAEQAFSPWTVSTSQQAALTQQNLVGEQQRQNLLNTIRAAPDPAALAKYNTNIAIGQQLVGIAGGFTGAALGGGGGQSQSGTAPPVQQQQYIPQYNYNPNGQYYPAVAATTGAWAPGGYG